MQYHRRSGCLGGLLQIFLLTWVFDWLQKRFGWGRGCSCGGVGCGFFLALLFFWMILATIAGWRIWPF
jgi:hypothetical protein